MLRDSTYQDLQFGDKNIYSILEEPASNHQKPSQDRQTSKDVKELERKLLIWRKTSTITSVCVIVVIIVGVAIFFMQCKTPDNKGLTELLMNICINTEKPCRYCPNNWIYFSEDCYFFSVALRNWTDSKDLSGRMDSHLVVIKNQEEETFFRTNSPGKFLDRAVQE